VIRIASRTLCFCVLLLTLTGCFQSTETSPLVPTDAGAAANVAQNPTAVPPTVDQSQAVNPTAIPPTDVQQPQVTNTPIPVQPPTDVPAVSQNPTDVGQAIPTVVQPTAVPPTEVPAPTQIQPTEIQPNQIQPTQVFTAIPPTAGLQVTNTPSPVPVASTIHPSAPGATGLIDANCMYTVEQDDHLIRIGLRFNRTVEDLARANPAIFNIQLIYVGQILRIPNCTAP